MKQKRTVAINDISCMGKCSLTVALPIISSLGIETVVLPTAVLSAHTAFEGFTFCDLTDEFVPVTEHWKKRSERFDCIYSGYLGSKRQIDLVGNFADDFRDDNTKVIIDPVLGDHGRLYTNFDAEFARSMAKLCAKADVITPNLTEASLLLQREYVGEGYTEEYIKNLLCDLSELGAKRIVLTGVSFDEKRLGVACYDAPKDEYFYYAGEKADSVFHGTGDVWASSFTAAFVKGYEFFEAAKIATDFTVQCIKATLEDKDEHWYGVKFENCLADFCTKYAK